MDRLINGPLDDLTVEAVAEHAGVSRALIFHYFPTLRDLHLVALQSAAEALVADLATAVAAAGPDEQLLAGLDAFVAFIEQQPQTFDRLAAMAASDPEFGSVFQSVREQAAGLLAVNLGVGQTPLEWALVLGWVSFVETVVRHWVAGPAEIDRSELVAVLLQSASALIRPTSPGPAPGQ